MGQKLSNSILQEQINRAQDVEVLLRLILDSVTLNLYTGTILDSPLDVVDDVVSGSKYLLTYSESRSQQVFSSQRVRKVLMYGQFLFILRKLSELERLLVAGSHDLGSDRKLSESDECMICMEKSVEIVLPCSHSFCTSCFEDWRRHNPTCPCCRKDLIPGETDEESWQIENWEQQDVKKRVGELKAEVLAFLSTLPDPPPDMDTSHRIVFLDEESRARFHRLNRQNRSSRDTLEHATADSIRENRFMGT